MMAGWDTDNGTSVTATEKLRAALPGRWRRGGALLLHETPSEQAPEAPAGLREDRLRLVADYIGDYPEDEIERSRCNRAFHQTPEAPDEQAAG
jgi:hypothetical protein